MSPLDIVILAAAIAAAVGGIVLTVRRKKQGKGCCGDCSRCGGCCHVDETKNDE